MTFSEELGYEPDVQDWIHTLPSGFEVWTAEHCDPKNWELPPVSYTHLRAHET